MSHLGRMSMSLEISVFFIVPGTLSMFSTTDVSDVCNYVEASH
jgi:hypothetical protein